MILRRFGQKYLDHRLIGGRDSILIGRHNRHGTPLTEFEHKRRGFPTSIVKGSVFLARFSLARHRPCKRQRSAFRIKRPRGIDEDFFAHPGFGGRIEKDDRRQVFVDMGRLPDDDFDLGAVFASISIKKRKRQGVLRAKRRVSGNLKHRRSRIDVWKRQITGPQIIQEIAVRIIRCACIDDDGLAWHGIKSRRDDGDRRFVARRPRRDFDADLADIFIPGLVAHRHRIDVAQAVGRRHGVRRHLGHRLVRIKPPAPPSVGQSPPFGIV